MLNDELKRMAERLRPIFEQHRIARAIVFGSLARGEASRRSDLDLIVVMDTEQRFLDRYDVLLAPLARAFPERMLDLLIYTPEELERLASRRFIARALREGQTIYECEQESV